MAIILNRRSFLRKGSALLVTAQTNPLLRTAWASNSMPIGLGMFTVAAEYAKDPQGTLRAVARMGYQVVEFSGRASYLNWTTEQAKDMRKLLDDLGIRCNSTHNDAPVFKAELSKAIDLNHIIGSKDLVMSGNNMSEGVTAGKVPGGLDAWKRLAEDLASYSEKLKAAGLRAGYHNHPFEFTPMDGMLPMDVIATNTPKEVTLQLCVGACMESNGDPVGFIRANPGRIRHIHLKDWAPGPDKGYQVLLGEGVSPWPQIFAAAESVGGVEFYVIDRIGRLRTLEIAQRSLANWNKLRQ